MADGGDAVTAWAADALLFDNDGVLVDSNAAGEVAWGTWALEYGAEPIAVIAGSHGRRSVETVRLHVPAERVAEATTRIDDLEIASADQTRAIPGAVELVASVARPRRAPW